jgi:hypothetical protein
MRETTEGVQFLLRKMEELERLTFWLDHSENFLRQLRMEEASLAFALAKTMRSMRWTQLGLKPKAKKFLGMKPHSIRSKAFSISNLMAMRPPLPCLCLIV